MSRSQPRSSLQTWYESRECLTLSVCGSCCFQTEDMQQEAIEVGKLWALLLMIHMCRVGWSDRAMLTNILFTAQEAMEKFNIEKVSPDWYTPETRTIANQPTGHCTPHQEDGLLIRLDHSMKGRLMVTQFDERKGVTWHCIVGRNFGSFVTHGRVAMKSFDRIDR
jgi:hypothetical protein